MENRAQSAIIRSMKNDEETDKLKLSIDELRRMNDELCSTYISIRNKTLAFIAGSFALLTYLYNGGDLFIPEQLYGKILYFIGLFLCLISIGILFLALHPVVWRMPTQSKSYKDKRSYLGLLQYIRDEYIEGIGINISHCSNKQKLLNLAFNLLVIGAILLLVIKNFNIK